MSHTLRDRLAARLGPETAARPSTHINLPPGWEPIVTELADRLDRLWPDWRLFQIKQKMGFLEVYLDQPPAHLADDLRAAGRDATRQAAHVCERCGSRQHVAHGPTTTGYLACLCDSCRAEIDG